MRCDSPPESVEARRSSVRYSSPTASRKCRRCLTSVRMLPAISCCIGESFSEPKNSFEAAIVIAATSQIFLPDRRTARASARSLCPLHSGHCAYPRYLLSITLTCSLYFLRSRYSKNPCTPRNDPLPLSTVSCCTSDRSCHGTSRGTPRDFAERFSSV